MTARTPKPTAIRVTTNIRQDGSWRAVARVKFPDNTKLTATRWAMTEQLAIERATRDVRAAIEAMGRHPQPPVEVQR